MAIVTVLGATGDTHLTVTVDGSYSERQADAFAQRLLDIYSTTDTTKAVHGLVSQDGGLTTSASSNYGAITEGSLYFVNSHYTDLVIGKLNSGSSVAGAGAGTAIIPSSANSTDEVLTQPVTVVAGGEQNTELQVLAGSASNVTYYAHYENGTIIGAGGSLNFYGSQESGSAGTYQIVTALNGKSTLYLGLSSNSVYSQGSDTIVGPYAGVENLDAGYSQQVTLVGSNSVVNTSSNSNIVDIGSGNSISVAGHSFISLGDQGTASLIGASSTVSGGTNSTVSATSSELSVIQGFGNSITSTGSLTFYNGTSNSTVTAANSTIFGAAGLNLKYNVTGDPTKSFFTASDGNETLDGSSSSNALVVYATRNGNLSVVGSNSDDTFVGGTANATFTGGLGDNHYMFQNGSGGGNDVITDFSASSGNKIELYNYNLTNETLQSILDSAQNTSQGKTIVLSDNTKITFTGVDNLSVNDFKLG
ncbi:calcium-binding protein [Entomobacter blattae]|uniref:Uncharacterized protein n=1 Tax=Entomobacter blattae TaxID=2762277 RepID=A0A7H1NQ80_9PROT|nr:calcium-binding protein [Entomobacter blattae]QNT77940.1 hypothetical protein JGUZn3_06980 [Entomobacter blattae]